MHRRPRLQADIQGKGRRDGVTTSVQAHTYSNKFTNRHVDLIFISGGDFLFCVCLEQHWRERPGESVWPYPPVMTIAGRAQHSAHLHTHRFLTARLICSDMQKLMWQAVQHLCFHFHQWLATVTFLKTIFPYVFFTSVLVSLIKIVTFCDRNACGQLQLFSSIFFSRNTSHN